MNMNLTAATGVPISLASISWRQVCRPSPKKVSGAQPTRRPRASAPCNKSHPSSRLIANGFSLCIDLPVRIAASPTSAWTSGVVRLMISSITGSAKASTMGSAWSTLNFSAWLWARDRVRLAQACKSRIFHRAAFSR